MSKIGELTDVGKFIRETLAGNPKMKNRDVADAVSHHFPDREFDVHALRQRIANYKFLARRNRTVIRIVTKN